jgi:hypothetical protein
MTDFSNYVHICLLDDFDTILVEKYKESYTLRERDLNKTFFDNLDSNKFIQSTVGKGKDDIINTDIRSSKIYKNINVRIKSKYEPYSRTINTKNIKPLKDSLDCSFTYNYDLIKYESGDHFNQFHYDTFRDNNVATILIFPPKSMCESYTGGDLVFKINEEEYRVEPSKFNDIYGDKFICVIFGYVLHKCEPILDGIRYVIKSNIKSKLPDILSDITKFKLNDIQQNIDNDDFIIKQKELNQIQLEKDERRLKEIIFEYYTIKMNYITENLPDNLEEYLEENFDYDYKTQQEIETLNQEYKEIIIKINRLRNMKYNDGYNNGYDYYKLDEKKYNICVLPYYIKNMENLLEYDISTRLYIKRKIEEGWNVTYMYKRFDFHTDYDEGYRRLENSDDIDYDVDEDYGNKYILHYRDNYVNYGKCIDYRSEYNDQSGNDIYEEYKCSCLLIWK